MTAFFQSLGLPYEWAWTVATVLAIVIVSLLVMFSVAMVIYVDRKVLGAIMMRRGPNVVGPFGLLQSFADGLKVFLHVGHSSTRKRATNDGIGDRGHGHRQADCRALGCGALWLSVGAISGTMVGTKR